VTSSEPTVRTVRTVPTDGRGGSALDEVRGWLGRFIVTLRADDLDVLTLWVAHTHLAIECYSSPRLNLDSAAPGAGKTTVLDHFQRLCARPVLMSQITSSAMLARLIHGSDGPPTLLLDEVDRSLSPDRQGSEDLLATLNSGYRFGSTRPVLIPSKESGWAPQSMSTFAPVVMAGNSPRLPDDTKSRTIAVVMVPASDSDNIEPSDWEDIEDQALEIGALLADWADEVRDRVKAIRAPDWLRNRDRDRWLPLIRTGTVAGGGWGDAAVRLARADLARVALDRADEVMTKTPSVQVLHDIAAVWREGGFIQTKMLIELLANEYPSRWGSDRDKGSLTPQGLGRMLANKHDIRAAKRYEGAVEIRGYYRSDFAIAWRRWGVSDQPSDPSRPSDPSGCSICTGPLDAAATLNGFDTCTDCETAALIRDHLGGVQIEEATAWRTPG
jgi:hypothetical protein